ncbi:MAG: methyltransferase, partial [Paenibacillus sp.]|nr:methyltransferase [Paenibacillus sp.]
VVRTAKGKWLFGECRENEAVWLKHKDKPRQYSTALTVKMARAVANIAIPQPLGVKAIDPCCGIGTIIIEALSMGIDIVGSDLNPQAVAGARLNLSHFGYPDVVQVRDMREITGRYDTAIVDLPYNLCSVLSEARQQEMLECARKLAARAVIIAAQPIDAAMEQAGFILADRCTVRKGSLIRHVMLGL